MPILITFHNPAKTTLYINACKAEIMPRASRSIIVLTSDTEYDTTTRLLRQQTRRGVLLLDEIVQQRAHHGRCVSA